MKQDMKKWVDEIRSSKIKKSLPVLSFPGIQLLGITVRDLVGNGNLQSACMIAIAEKYDSLASVSNMDLSVEAEAFGAQILYSDTEVPTVTGSLIQNEDQIDSMIIPEIGIARTGEYIKAIEIASRSINDRPVLAGVIGPFSLGGRLMEITEFMIKSITEPEVVHKILIKVSEFLREYILAFKEAGANGIIMAEPAAGLLSPELCSEFSSFYIKKIIDSVEDDNFLVIYHNCGNTIPLTDSILSTGAKAIHLGNSVELTQAIKQYPPDKLIFGNLDPSGIFMNGSTETIENETLNLLYEMGKYSNWIISSGCDIPPLTPIQNLDVFFHTVKKYYSN